MSRVSFWPECKTGRSELLLVLKCTILCGAKRQHTNRNSFEIVLLNSAERGKQVEERIYVKFVVTFGFPLSLSLYTIHFMLSLLECTKNEVT